MIQEDTTHTEQTEGEFPTSPQDSARFKALLKASGLAIGVDLLLIVLKYALGSLTGSSVLFADALHSVGDLAVSAIVLCSIVVHYLFKDADWARYLEMLVALQISFFLALGSLNVMNGVLNDTGEYFRLTRGIPLVIAVAGISLALIVIFAMSRFKRRIGEQYASIAFIAEGMHTKSDFFTSLGVWLTLVLGYFNVQLERVATFIVGLVVLHISVQLFLRTLRSTPFIPKCVEGAKRLLPDAVKSWLVGLRLRTHSLAAACRSFASRFPFLHEEWLVARTFPVLAASCLLLLLLYLGTGFYTVEPFQTGLELFFGRVSQQTSPGLHIHAPKPFGDIIRVDTAVTARLESGFRTKINFTGQEPDAYLWEFSHVEGRYARAQDEAISITGDETLIDANFLCYYRIVDPVQYAFETEDAHEILRKLFGHHIHAELLHYRLDELLTVERADVQHNLLNKMRQAVVELPLGVEILNVYMREAHPPVEVVPSYRAVASARENKIEIIHTAHTYANALLPLSKGEAAAKIATAEGDAVEQVSAALEATRNFLFKQEIFRQTEAAQRVRLWWNTVEVALKEKSLYILPKDAKRRLYSSEASFAAGSAGSTGLRAQEDDNYYGSEEHIEEEAGLGMP